MKSIINFDQKISYKSYEKWIKDVEKHPIINEVFDMIIKKCHIESKNIGYKNFIWRLLTYYFLPSPYNYNELSNVVTTFGYNINMNISTDSLLRIHNHNHISYVTFNEEIEKIILKQRRNWIIDSVS